MFRNKKRLLLAASALASLGAIAALAVGVTFGFFSATSTPQYNAFATGDVTMNSVATSTCGVTNMVPGDSGTCQLTANYTGSAPANMALDLSISSATIGSGGTAYDGSDAGLVVAGKYLFDGVASGNGLQLTLTDTHTGAQYIFNGTQWKTISGTDTNLTADSGATGSVTNLFAGTYTTGQSTVFTLAWSLPTGANDAYQNAATTFRLQAHAAQSGNNAATGCTAGRQCNVPAWN